MDGLIIKPEWLHQIYHVVTPFDEQKTWELRSRKTKKRGRIYLLSSGGYVTGEANITNCIEIRDEKQWLDNIRKHQVWYTEYYPEIVYTIVKHRMKTIYAWILDDIVEYEEPILYHHPKGAIIWVKNIESIMEKGEYIRTWEK